MVVERARHCHMNTEANQKQKETVKEKFLSEKILKCKNNHLQTSDGARIAEQFFFQRHSQLFLGGVLFV